jgi:RNA polymerase sigma-70 factor (ECF subfamily)
LDLKSASFSRQICFNIQKGKSVEDGTDMIENGTGLCNNRTDSELMKAVAEKDKDAFKQIMSRYQKRVYKLVYRFTGDGEMAQELTQDIFLKVFKAAKTYTPEAQFFTWLYRIATNHCINFARKNQRDPLYKSDNSMDEKSTAVSSHNGYSSQLEILEEEEMARLVRRALDTLANRQRMAIVLLRFEDFTYKEIAKVLGCSVSAVESLIFRGMESLKRRFSEIIGI